ncbi:MAG: M20 family metallopeptidase [Solirubrobacteraceae bacterium]
MTSAAGILDRLRGQELEMTALLEQLAKAESPSVEPATQARPFATLADELRSIGFEVERLPGRGTGDHLEARPQGRRGAYQLLLGHMDTVWPTGTLEQMPVVADDDRVRGPGVYDMKGGLVQMVFALRALHDLHAHSPLAPVVFVNSDEEIGSHDSSTHIRRLAAGAKRAFVLEPSFGPSGKLKTARKGAGYFKVTVEGRASHAGLDPEKGASAILEVSHQIQRLFALNDRERGISVNVGTIDGGLRPNVVAPKVSAEVDVRVLHAEDVEAVEQAILGLTPVEEGVAVEVAGEFDCPPLERTERNVALWHAAQGAARELGIDIDEATVGGTSDGNITSQYTATLDGLGPVGDGAHASHEYVVASQMPERAALLALLLLTPACS